jgi:hypothetical protein
MAWSAAIIGVISRACITRYNEGEREITDIVESYGYPKENEELILAKIYSQRPDLIPVVPTPEPTPGTEPGTTPETPEAPSEPKTE